MDIIKSNDNTLSVVELVKGNKHLKLSLSKYDELEASFSYGDTDKGYWFQENFEIDKNDEEVYNAVDGVFLSYSGDVYFDTMGANLILMNTGDKYSFFFMKEFDQGANEIKAKFFNDSMENTSMKFFFKRLEKLEPKEDLKIEKAKSLSKTLNKIVEKK